MRLNIKSSSEILTSRFQSTSLYIPQNLQFHYGDTVLEITHKYTYLGIVFTTDGSFPEAQSTLSGQAQKAIFVLNNYIRNFVNVLVSPGHVLDLF